MTPALLFALDQQFYDDMGMLTLPVDKLAWIYANAHRDTGEKDSNGREVRPPSPPYDLELFRTYGRKFESLAAKETETWDYSLLGAKADKGAFEAWALGKPQFEYTPTPIKEN